jgi:hypothetical protein
LAAHRLALRPAGWQVAKAAAKKPHLKTGFACLRPNVFACMPDVLLQNSL